MIVIERPQPREAAAGFTLIEALAALAIASVVIVATASLIHDVALNFDRGTSVANSTDRLLLAVERLASDFASARLVPRTDGQTDVAVAFVGEPSQVRFIAGGGSPGGPQGEEVLSLVVEDVDGLHRLVRRRAKWPIPQGTFTSVLLQDPVRLFEGRIDIEFS